MEEESLPEDSGPQPGVIYYIDDHLGNAHIITDSHGNVLREENRYPYGLERSSSTSASTSTSADYVYTGKEYDTETGLIYFGGRYYSPELGRWITADPLFIENPAEVVGTFLEGNLYAYVVNNPVRYTDPDGMRTDFNVGVKPMYDHLVTWGEMTREQKIVDGIGTGVVAVTTVAPIAAAVGLIAAPIVIAATPFVGDMILSASVAAYSAQTVATGAAATEVGVAAGVAKTAGYTAVGFAVTHPVETYSFGVGFVEGLTKSSTGLSIKSTLGSTGAGLLGKYVGGQIELFFRDATFSK